MVVEAGVGKMGHVNLNIMAIGFSKADTGTSFGAELEVAAKGVRGDFIVGKHESAETPHKAAKSLPARNPQRLRPQCRLPR